MVGTTSILQHGKGRIAGNPIRNSLELAQWLQRECGADGYRIHGNLLIALRWDLDGNEVIVERFELQALIGRDL